MELRPPVGRIGDRLPARLRIPPARRRVERNQRWVLAGRPAGRVLPVDHARSPKNRRRFVRMDLVGLLRPMAPIRIDGMPPRRAAPMDAVVGIVLEERELSAAGSRKGDAASRNDGERNQLVDARVGGG